MKKNRFRPAAIFGLGLALWTAGCQSTPTLTGEPPPKKGPIDLVNDTLGLVNDGYVLGTEALEYIGDKTQDTTDTLGEVYQSL